MAPALAFNLPDDLLGSIDQEVAAGRYGTREEFVRRAVESLLARKGIEPAEYWTGETGLRLMEQAARRLPYEHDADSN